MGRMTLGLQFIIKLMKTKEKERILNVAKRSDFSGIRQPQ